MYFTIKEKGKTFITLHLEENPMTKRGGKQCRKSKKCIPFVNISVLTPLEWTEN